MTLLFENSRFLFKPVTRPQREAIKQLCWKGRNVQYFPLLPISLMSNIVLQIITYPPR